MNFVVINDQLTKKKKYRKFDAKIRTEIESQTVESLKLTIQNVSITNVI